MYLEYKSCLLLDSACLLVVYYTALDNFVLCYNFIVEKRFCLVMVPELSVFCDAEGVATVLMKSTTCDQNDVHHNIVACSRSVLMKK